MSALAPLRRARVLAAGVLATLAVVLVTPAATAHDLLIASDPAEGAALTEPPQAITLTFNNPPLDVGSAIIVTDADGETVAEGEGTVEGADVTLELGSDLPSGDYEARWRVASSDGHPIDGVIAFTVQLPGEAGESPAQPAAEATAEATTPPAATANPAPPAEEATATGLSSLPLWLRIAIALAALASVVGLIVRVVRRRRGDRV